MDSKATAAVSDQAVVPAASDQAVVRAVPDQAVVLEDLVSELELLALALEEVSEAVLLPFGVDRDFLLPAPEAFPTDPPTYSWAAHKAQAPLVLAAATVVTMDLQVMATAMMLLVWAAATD